MGKPAEHSTVDSGDPSTRVPALPPVDLLRAEPAANQAGAAAVGAPRIGAHEKTLDGSLPPSSTDATRDPDRIGAYRVIRKIGEGGMGVVYEAEQASPVRRTVAVKVIKIGMDSKDVVARFDAERQALAMMNHSGVARVFDAGMTAAGRPYFAMEFVQGVPLVDYCDQNRLTTAQRLELFIAICLAVQHAHQKGIIHRDLKPSNILVTRVDGKPVPKVIDFGIAKATTQALTDQPIHTVHGALIGTPEYASPEQAVSGGLDVDTRSDIYSLGVLLYQLLTGTLPLDSRTLMREGPSGIAKVLREVEPPKPSRRLYQLQRGEATQETLAAARGPRIEQLARSRRVDPASLSRQLKGDLDWITLKAMEKDRSRRYATAAELANDLARHLADEPVLARPQSRRYRVMKFMRRHRLGVAAFVTMLLLLVGGIVGTSTGMIRAWISQANVERAQAVAQRETRKSIVASLEAAERLLPGNAADAERLAAPAYQASAAALGEEDPLTLDAADVLARVHLARGQPAEARRMLESVVQRVRSAGTQPAALAAAERASGGRYASPGRFFADLAQAIRVGYESRGDVVEGTPSADESQRVVALYREALSAFRQDPGDASLLRLEVGADLAAMLVANDDLTSAEQAYLNTLADHRSLLGDTDARTRSIADRLSTVRVWTGQHESALQVVREQLRLAIEAQAPADELITRQMDIADLLMRMGRTDEANEAFAEAVAESRRRRAGADGPTQVRWRQLTLRSGLGDARNWKSRALYGHAWVAVSEALSRNPARYYTADEVNLPSATFTLERWNGDSGAGPASTELASGTMDQLRGLPDPPQGLYLLALRIPRSEQSPTPAATWVLMADWDVSLHTASPGGGSWTQMLWAALHARPAEQFRSGCLFMLDDGNYGERVFGMQIGGGPDGQPENFAARATAAVALPPGLYLAAVTADDGVRLHADDQALVDDWRPRMLQADAVALEFGGQPRNLRVEYFQNFGEFVLRVQPEPMSPAADAMMAKALGPQSGDTRRWLLRRGQSWERLERWREAAECYRKAVQVGVQQTSTELEAHLQALRGFRRASVQSGEGAAVAQVVEAAAARARPGEVAAETLLYGARQHSLAGRTELAGTLCTRAIVSLVQARSITEVRGAELGRRAVLTRLGAPNTPNDGGLPAQLFGALDEAMLEDRTLVPRLKDVSAGDVRWKLVHWDPPGNPTVGEGTLADAAGRPAPPPGVYLVQLRIETPDVKHVSAHWVLFARWQWSAFVPETERMFDRFAFNSMTSNRNRAVDQGEAEALVMVDSLATEPIPDAPEMRYALTADARLRLPAGRYRVIGSAADGLRVIIDDRRVINSWPARQSVRQDVADIVRGGTASTSVQVYHYRTGGDDKLMVRIQPLDPAAAALAALNGRKPRSIDSVMTELDEAVREDSFHGWAFGMRGALHARAGRSDQAATDIAVAIEIDNAEPLWPALRAALAMRESGESGLNAAIAEWPRQSLATKERAAAAQSAVVMLLQPGRPTQHSDTIEKLLSVATIPSPLGGTPPAARFARALIEYRRGRPESAAWFARNAREVTALPGHVVMCDLLLAMIARDAGRDDEAAALLGQSTAQMQKWSAEPELFDPFDALDWVICQALQAQAAREK